LLAAPPSPLAAFWSEEAALQGKKAKWNEKAVESEKVEPELHGTFRRRRRLMSDSRDPEADRILILQRVGCHDFKSTPPPPTVVLLLPESTPEILQTSLVVLVQNMRIWLSRPASRIRHDARI
jgi:hypothetical protein